MSRDGACPCGGVRFTISGPVRHVLVCHCNACQEATGGPWAATAARRTDLSLVDDAAVIWERAEVSEYGASRGRCSQCGTTVFWAAPKRETVSLALTALADQAGLDVVAHIWTGGTSRIEAGRVPCYAGGLPRSIAVPWVE